MRTATLVAVAAVAIAESAVPVGAQSTNVQNELQAVQSQFVGHYQLVSYLTFARDGETRDMDFVGRLTYDEFGNMAAQGMPRELPTRVGAADGRVPGGFAYWGSVSFDLEKGVVIHHVEGSPNRANLIGADNVRYFEFSGDLLKLSLKDSEGRVTATLSWRKYQN